MSYMNDGTDPFGVPYDTPYSKEYTTENILGLDKEINNLQRKLRGKEQEKKEAIGQLKIKFERILPVNAKVKFNGCYPEIRTKTISFEVMDELKQITGARDIVIELENDYLKVTFVR